MESDEPRVLVIGAGPKGVAIAAKAKVLSKLRVASLKVRLIERGTIGANWSGKQSIYTNGEQSLATSPLKDVGFPYHSTDWGDRNRDIDSEMLSYSWQAFLVDKRGADTAEFSLWVDRGLAPPALWRWAAYLGWVAKKSEADVLHGTVKSISISDGKWKVEVDTREDGEVVELGEGLVITGPGEVLLDGYDFSVDRSPAIIDAKNFWHHLAGFDSLRDGARIAVVGAGGAASSIAVALTQIGKHFRIEIITPDGVIYSRGESFDENRHYSDPKAWQAFGPESKKKFLEHTTNGVFDSEAKRILNVVENVETVGGTVSGLEVADEDSDLGVFVYLRDRAQSEHYDRVIVATGFDDCWWLSLVDQEILQRLDVRMDGGDSRRLRGKIGPDLSVETFKPRLHLPMVASEQGPGFFNLTSLGLLSDRILYPYATRDRMTMGGVNEPAGQT
ncbi:hypothetical protein [Streptomyces sp. NPDC093094]|uniref:hypothetical protein n=1 Tax=Streptomyces sp. NPDC093094 TaxID=3366026 RepID=UPI003824EE4A